MEFLLGLKTYKDYSILELFTTVFGKFIRKAAKMNDLFKANWQACNRRPSLSFQKHFSCHSSEGTENMVMILSHKGQPPY
jgi:hypothetical protein